MRNEMWDLPGMNAMRHAGIMEACEACGDPVMADDAGHGTIGGIEYDVLCRLCAEDVEEAGECESST